MALPNCVRSMSCAIPVRELKEAGPCWKSEVSVRSVYDSTDGSWVLGSQILESPVCHVIFKHLEQAPQNKNKIQKSK
jgi:hypothetical protein